MGFSGGANASAGAAQSAYVVVAKSDGGRSPRAFKTARTPQGSVMTLRTLAGKHVVRAAVWAYRLAGLQHVQEHARVTRPQRRARRRAGSMGCSLRRSPGDQLRRHADAGGVQLQPRRLRLSARHVPQRLSRRRRLCTHGAGLSAAACGATMGCWVRRASLFRRRPRDGADPLRGGLLHLCDEARRFKAQG